jgi:hypothetical protein
VPLPPFLAAALHELLAAGGLPGSALAHVPRQDRPPADPARKEGQQGVGRGRSVQPQPQALER